MQRNAAEGSERGRVLRVPGCGTWYRDWAVWVLSREMKRSLPSEAQLWHRFALDEGGFLMSSLPSSLTAPEPLLISFFCCASSGGKRALDTVITLVRPSPPECTLLKYLCLAVRRPLLMNGGPLGN